MQLRIVSQIEWTRLQKQGLRAHARGIGFPRKFSNKSLRHTGESGRSDSCPSSELNVKNLLSFPESAGRPVFLRYYRGHVIEDGPSSGAAGFCKTHKEDVYARSGLYDLSIA